MIEYVVYRTFKEANSSAFGLCFLVLLLSPQLCKRMHDADEPEAMTTALNGVELMIQAHAEAGLEINAPA